jgi:hypothetical protein
LHSHPGCCNSNPLPSLTSHISVANCSTLSSLSKLYRRCASKRQMTEAIDYTLSHFPLLVTVTRLPLHISLHARLWLQMLAYDLHNFDRSTNIVHGFITLDRSHKHCMFARKNMRLGCNCCPTPSLSVMLSHHHLYTTSERDVTLIPQQMLDTKFVHYNSLIGTPAVTPRQGPLSPRSS